MNQEPEKKDIDQNRDVAAFSYFLILSWVILYTRKDSKFIQFHAKQASVLFTIFIVIMILPGGLSKLNLFTLALAITGLLQANQGKWWQMPFISYLIKSGVSEESTRKVVVRIFKTLKGAVLPLEAQQKKSEKITEITKNTEEPENVDSLKSTIGKLESFLELQMDKLSSLEQQLLVEKFLKKAPLRDMSVEYRDAVEELKKSLISSFPGKVTREEMDDHMLISNKNKQMILIGGFEEKSLMVFLSAPIPDAEKVLGDFSGLRCDPLDKTSCETVVTAIQTALKK